MNIERQFVTIEQAMLLKEKGFDIRCEYFYNEGSGYKLQHDPILRTGKDVFFEAPEIWQVVEWLRLKHKIDLSVVVSYGGKWVANLVKDWTKTHKGMGNMNYFDTTKQIHNDFAGYTSPQEAYSAAINYIVSKLI